MDGYFFAFRKFSLSFWRIANWNTSFWKTWKWVWATLSGMLKNQQTPPLKYQIGTSGQASECSQQICFRQIKRGSPNWWPPFYMIITVRDNHSSSYSCSACTRMRLSAHKKTGISARFAQWYCYFRWEAMKQVKENYDYRISEGWGMLFTCYEKSIWLGL